MVQKSHSFLEISVRNRDIYHVKKYSLATNGHAVKKEKWTRLTEPILRDATASAQVHLDYQGGKTKDNRFI